MAKTKLMQAAELGQSIWLDYLRRDFIDSGELRDYVEQGLRGVTSNPAIFAEAISESAAYDEQLKQIGPKDLPAKKIYELLAVEDIQRAAEVLRPVYERSEGMDGFISLEVNPHLAHNTQATIAEAHQLFHAVDRPNVMIKVPATAEGLPAITTLTAEGVNINVTLMFSETQYDLVADAYLTGLEERFEHGRDLSKVCSVASIFVSRVDVMVDEMLSELDTQKARDLRGKIGIANSNMIYQRFKRVFTSGSWRWSRLASQGAALQRVLFGSTSTKNPTYPDTLYPDNLIAPHTINTLPPDTLEAFIDHGKIDLTLEENLLEAEKQLAELGLMGIDLNEVTRRLLIEGVRKFEAPFDQLLTNIVEKQNELKIGV